MIAFDSSSRHAWEAIANFGTYLVIGGVAGEGFEICLKLFKKKRERLSKWYDKHEFGIELLGAMCEVILNSVEI